MPREIAVGRGIRSSGAIASGRAIAVGRSIAGDTALLRDTFIDANGTNLTAHTMDTGSGWTVHAGSAQIQNNELDVVTLGPSHGIDEFLASANAGQANVIASARLAAGTTLGVTARMSDADN